VIKNRLSSISLVTLLIFIFSMKMVSGAEIETDQPLDRLLLDYKKDDLNIVIDYKGEMADARADCRDIAVNADWIELSKEVAFGPEGLVWNDLVIPYAFLKRTEIEKVDKGHVKIMFNLREPPEKRRIPRDVINSFTSIIIDEDRFVRGDVINIAGNVDIFGEVSKSVICLFGDVILHPKSVVRGDVIAICGRVRPLEGSQVYGQIISQKGWQKGGRRWASMRGYYKQFSLIPSMDYNRVDGLFLNGEFKYEDPDHVFPTIFLGMGYAFEAERLRYNLGFSQKFFNYYSIQPYGEVYRRTQTEDDWICSRNENIAFALIVNEDFRDYYEEEGGVIGMKVFLGPYNTFDFRYSYDAISGMDAHPLLWSLFGKKEFRANFSTLPYELRQTYEDDFDSKMSLFKITYTLDTKMSGIRNPTGWYGSFQFERAGGDLKGDLSFSRWIFSLARFQEINRYLALNLRIMYAGSHDRLPIFKKYFLGGLRTLRGYKHKLFYGDQMFLANAEYLVELYNDLDVMLFFDIGKVLGQKDDIFDDGEFKSDVGIALGFFPGFRIELAKALDKSDSDIKLWVTFERTF